MKGTVPKGSGHEFCAPGAIQQILDGRRIVISGVAITVRGDAEIKDDEGNLLDFADLTAGQQVRTKGSIVEGVFEAFEVKFRDFDERVPRIRFEGVVASISGDRLQVTIEGVGEAVVLVTEDTRIKGTLAVGVFRLAPGEAREVSLRLDGPAPQGGLDVALSLEEGPEGVVEFPAVAIIPAGARGVRVTIVSLGEAGEVEIRARLPEAVGGDDDELEVQIRDAMGRDDDQEDDDGEEEMSRTTETMRTIKTRTGRSRTKRKRKSAGVLAKSRWGSTRPGPSGSP